MVFSFHRPESLYAEIWLVSLALIVFLYRMLGGRSDWLSTHGVILTTYYAVGGIVYDELEGWPLLDTTYFLTVTITTVGYGDMCPETDEGKMFTVIYALIGIVFVFAALEPLVGALKFINSILLLPCTPPDPGPLNDLVSLRANGNWGFKYATALMGPGVIFVLGLGIGFFVMSLDLVDGIYWSMITMTTIGYGDISGSSTMEKAVLIIYLPTAVAALADALGIVAQISTAKDLIYTDFAKQADTLLLGEAGGPDPNPDETLTEAEFLISVLKDNGIVDDMTVNAIRLQFAHITRHDTSASDNKVLDDRMVFLELRAQGRIVQSAPRAPKQTADGSKVEQVDLQAADGGFQEWLETYWWPRVFDGKPVGPQVRLNPLPTPKSGVGKTNDGKTYKRLAEEKLAGKAKAAGTGSHRSPRLLGPSDAEAPPPVLKGYFMDGQMSVADGEYVWMPKADAAKAKAKTTDDKDVGLWVVLLCFAIYFVWKAVPDIYAYHAGEAAGTGEETARLLRRLAEMQSGDDITAARDMAARLLARR